MTTPVIIVDDHPLFRKGIEHLLANQTDIAIVGQYGDLKSVQKDLENNIFHADVVILDRILGDDDGLSLVPLLKERNIKVIILTMANDDFEIKEAIQLGVDGYILKCAEPEQIIQAILSVIQGHNLYPSSAMKKMIDSKLIDNDLQKLSHRELEIITYVARGLSNRAIGESLELSENTVRNHLRSILEKLNLNNRVQVATFALKRGIGKRSPIGLSAELEKSSRSRL